jgi:phenylacetate-coenzyme A ligase PaaK-like adenylate-forming protein
MEIWETIEFGARAFLLQAGAAKPPNEIERLARSRLQQLVAHARGNSAFWSDKLASVDGDSFELTDLPISNKTELMENFDQAVTVDDVRRDEAESFLEDEANIGKYFRDKYVLSRTSGTQGRPLVVVQPKDNLELLFALQVSRGNQHAISLTDAVKHFVWPARLAAIIFKPGFYASATAFGYMPAGAKQYMDVKVLCACDDDMIERLADFSPTHLTAYASMLHQIAREIEAGRLSLPDLEQVVNISERLLPHAREHYTHVFGTPVLDNYSMGECLFLANGCPTSGGMHLNADWAILEVVDEYNRLVPVGEKGAKVLVTNLANYVQPIIRYEIGDIIRMSTKPCGCGSTMPLIDHIDGRDSEWMYVKTDIGLRPLPPMIIEIALNQMLHFRDYQLIQEEDTRVRALIEPLPGVAFDRDRANRIMHEQLQRYGLDQKLEVELETVDSLKPEGDHKYQRVVCKVRTDSTQLSHDSNEVRPDGAANPRNATTRLQRAR